ncbi:DUF4157 domain-containing protein [Actinoplanes sp. NPDC000266]
MKAAPAAPAAAPTTRRKPAASSARVPRDLREVLAAPGRPIDLGVRRDAENRLGHDFSRVRVHADRDAAALTEILGAEAVTVGQDIFFAEGRYRPDTAEGTRLLVHELLHTIQVPHAPGALRAGRDSGAVSLATDAVEQEAERIATGDATEVRERDQQSAAWLRLATVGADRQRTEHLDPATLVDRLAAGLVRSLRGDPEDRSGRVKLQLARFTPELRSEVLDRIEARLPSAEFLAVKESAAEADAAPGDGAVESAETPAPVTEPTTEEQKRQEAEEQTRQGDEAQQEQVEEDESQESPPAGKTPTPPGEDPSVEDPSAEDLATEDEPADETAQDEKAEEEKDPGEEEKDKEEKDKEKKQEKAASKEEQEKSEAEKGKPGTPAPGAPGTVPPATAAPVAGPGASPDAALVGAGGAEPVMAESVDEIAEGPNSPLTHHGVLRPEPAALVEEPPPLDAAQPDEALPSEAPPGEAEPDEPPPDLLPKTDLDVSSVPTADQELRLPSSGEPPKPSGVPSFPAPPPLEPAAEEQLAAEAAGPAPAPGPAALGSTEPAALEAAKPTVGPTDPALGPASLGPASLGPGAPSAADLGTAGIPAAGAGAALGDTGPITGAGPGVPSELAPGNLAPDAPGAAPIPQDASLEPGGGACGGPPQPSTEEAGAGGCGGGGGAAGGEEKQEPEPAPPDVSGQEPAAALATTANLPPHQMTTALAGVDQASARTVGEEHTALADAPPELDRPSGAPQTLHGAPETAPVAENTVGRLERVTPENTGQQDAPHGKDVNGKPLPASAVPSPNVAGTPEGDLTADDVDNIEAAVDSVPTSDPALNSATVGPAPTVDLQGETDPALTDEQSRKLAESSGKLAAVGRDDAARPLGEDQIFPDVPPETLRAEVPAPQPAGIGAGPAPGGPGPGPGGPAGPGGAQMQALSVVAQEERGPQIQASAGEGQAQMAAGRQEKDAGSAAAREESSAEVAAAVQQGVELQTLERARAQEEANGQRAEWRSEQETLLTDNGKQATEHHGTANKDITTEHDSKNNEIKKEQENHNDGIQAEREKAERDARKEKEKAKEDEGGFWGWVKSKVKALFDAIISAIKTVFEYARKAVQGLIDGFKKLATGLIEAARRFIVAAIQVLADALIAIADVLLAAFPGLRDKFRQFITELRDKAINAVNELADQLKKGVEALLDLLGKALTALLDLYEKALLAAVELVRSAVNKAIEWAKAAIDALGQLAALIADIAPDPIGWIKKLGTAAKEGIRNHLWGEIKIAVKQWFNQKVEGILGLGKMVYDILVKGCMSVAEIGRMAWQAVVKALPVMIISLVIEKLVSLIIPAAGAVLAIAQGLIAAYGTISQIITAFAKFFAFLKAVKNVAGAACLFAQAMAAGVVALLEFITNFLLTRLGMALKKVGAKLKGLAKKIADKLRKPSAKPGGRPGGADGVNPGRPSRPGVEAAPSRTSRSGGRPYTKDPGRRRPRRRSERPGRDRLGRPRNRQGPRRSRRPDRQTPQRTGRDRRRPKQTKDERLNRAAARIRPIVQRLLNRGVRRGVLNAVLGAMRLWYRLSAVEAEGLRTVLIRARLNPQVKITDGLTIDDDQLLRFIAEVAAEIENHPDTVAAEARISPIPVDPEELKQQPKYAQKAEVGVERFGIPKGVGMAAVFRFLRGRDARGELTHDTLHFLDADAVVDMADPESFLPKVSTYQKNQSDTIRNARENRLEQARQEGREAQQQQYEDQRQVQLQVLKRVNQKSVRRRSGPAVRENRESELPYDKIEKLFGDEQHGRRVAEATETLSHGGRVTGEVGRDAAFLGVLTMGVEARRNPRTLVTAGMMVQMAARGQQLDLSDPENPRAVAGKPFSLPDALKLLPMAPGGAMEEARQLADHLDRHERATNEERSRMTRSTPAEKLAGREILIIRAWVKSMNITTSTGSELQTADDLKRQIRERMYKLYGLPGPR